MDKFNYLALSDEEYMSLVEDVLMSEGFQKLSEYPHHNECTRLDHCLHVSYSVYLFFKKYAPDYPYLKEACRGALLHDFFLYDWHTENPFPVPCMHAWLHPKWAYNDAKKVFSLTPVEKDIITKHMFPVSINPPRTKASWMVVIFDKYWAFKEGIAHFNLIEFIKLQFRSSANSKMDK